MAKLVFRLNDVPEDEADAVRALLSDNHIDYYETSAGNWGFSVAGIWIKHNEDRQRARQLIDAYQQQLSDRPTETVSFTQLVLQQPLRVIIYLLIVAFILYVSIMPFMRM